jgi:hypothetical protein
MNRNCKLAVAGAAMWLVLALPAFAGSVYDFHKETISGTSGSTLSGSFTFTGNANGGTFSNITLSFDGGKFGGLKASDVSGGKAKCAFGFCRFSWSEKLSNGWVWDTIVLNVKTGSFQDLGQLYTKRNQWNFDPPPTQVPEGGTSLAYLMLAGLAVFAGILVSGKKRRTARSTVIV